MPAVLLKFLLYYCKYQWGMKFSPWKMMIQDYDVSLETGKLDQYPDLLQTKSVLFQLTTNITFPINKATLVQLDMIWGVCYSFIALFHIMVFYNFVCIISERNLSSAAKSKIKKANSKCCCFQYFSFLSDTLFLAKIRFLSA